MREVNETTESGATVTCPSHAPLRERQRQVREEAILEAARALVAEHGYEAMTMDDLAARAGISKPTLYQHFPSKESVVVRAVVAMMEGTLDFIGALPADLSGREKIERIIRRVVFQKFVQHRTSFGPARAALAPILRSHPDYRRVFGQMLAAVLGMIEAAKIEGDVAPALRSRLVAQMVFSLLRDCEYEELIERGECTPEEVVETLVSVLFNGMRGGARSAETL
jgi:AcrR family transcriptional regulator